MLINSRLLSALVVKYYKYYHYFASIPTLITIGISSYDLEPNETIILESSTICNIEEFKGGTFTLRGEPLE